MNYNYWKPVFCGILLTAVISAEARPAENHIESLESDRTDGVHIVEHKIGDDDAPIKSLPFYGGAKGKYLLIHPSGRTSITNRNPSFFGLKGEEDGDEDVGMEEEGLDENESTANGNSSSSGSGGAPDESVCVGSPPDNASVAEAKPVGLAVAGPGGVAASKPVGTAISGPGGLSVARPVATAIAGVPGAEGLVGLGGANKKKYERPLKTSVPVVVPVNKTKEERSFVGRRNRHNDDVELEYSNSIPSHHKLFYIPVYLPDDYNPQY